jgi:hypothetical protein
MANNLIQIKRTSVSGRAANTSTLQNAGELALNMADGILYSSNGSSVFEIGANNTNVNITGNATVKAVVANGSIGTAGYLLSSGGTGSNVYWVNVATLTANAANYVVANAGIVSNSSGVFVNTAYIGTLSANNTTYVNGKTESNLNVNNSVTSNTSNTSTYLGAAANFGNSTGIYSSGIVNAASHSVGSTWVANTSGVYMTQPLSANGGVGTSGQVLTSNGATGSPYWSTVSGSSTNVAAQYTWTNTHTFNANVTFGAGIIANGSIGTAGQVLFSNGSSAYWAGANTGTGTSQTFTSTGTSTITLSAAINPADAIVNLNGLTLIPTTDYTITSTTLTFTTTPASGDLIEVRTFSGLGVAGSGGITTGKAIAMAIVFGG